MKDKNVDSVIWLLNWFYMIIFLKLENILNFKSFAGVTTNTKMLQKCAVRGLSYKLQYVCKLGFYVFVTKISRAVYLFNCIFNLCECFCVVSLINIVFINVYRWYNIFDRQQGLGFTLAAWWPSAQLKFTTTVCNM